MNGQHDRGERGDGRFSATRSVVSDTSNTSYAPPASLRASNPMVPPSARELFEDEMKRIIASCFDKKDPNGNPLQQYITHLRVEEDGANPSSPPPPDASHQYKKPRVVILGVKLGTGRVFMHKARENTDGSFQVGKTWPLEELQSIETFNIWLARTSDEQQRCEWAGPTGFVVTMAKPYYWKAVAVKEKDHFISALVSVYRKYRNDMPQLIGFDENAKAILAGNGRPSSNAMPPQQASPRQPAPLQMHDRRLEQARQASEQSSTQGSRTSNASSEQRRPPSPFGALNTVEGDGQPRQQWRQLPPAQENNIQPLQQLRGGSGQLQPPQPPRAQDLRSVPSRDQMRPLRLQPSQPAFSLRAQPSRPNVTEQVPSQSIEPYLAGSARTTQSEFNGPIPANLEESTLLSSTASQWKPQGLLGKATDSVTRQPGNPRNEGDAHDLPSVQTASPAETSRQVIPERRRPPLESSSSWKQGSFRSGTGRSSSKPRMTIPSPNGATSTGIKPGHLSPETSADTTGPFVPPVLPPIAREIQNPETAPLSTKFDERPTPDIDNPDQEPTSPASNDQSYRPGLGPMMGKKADAANKFRKAATAYSAFKPRAGGAGERLLKSKASEMDGVTKVSPAPLSRAASQDSVKPRLLEVDSQEKPSTPLASKFVLDTDTPETETPPADAEVDEISETLPQIDAPRDAQPEVVNSERPPIPTARRPRSPEPVKIQSEAFAKSLAAMDIDLDTLQGRESEYEAVFEDFGWLDNILQAKQIDSLETGLRREIGRLEAGSWLVSSSDQKDERIEVVERMLDKAIAECDEMEGLLTLYGVELSTLNDDIAYIEAQSQGLQVQTANQRLLQLELQKLVNIISINKSQLQPLKSASLADPQGLEAIEGALLMLHRALHTIDPSLINRSDGTNTMHAFGDQDMRSMRALREKKQLYQHETHDFLGRLKKMAEPTFAYAFQQISNALQRNGASNRSLNLETGAHDLARNSLWQYSSLMLFAKEVDPVAWQDMMTIYSGIARNTYQDEFRDNVMLWKKATRKSNGDELEALFTSQEKDFDGLTSTARKLTVKRSATMSKSLRAGLLEKRLGIDKSQESKDYPYECFTGVLEETMPLVSTEQNFIVDFFHANSLQSADFVESVTSARPLDRRNSSLLVGKPFEPDRAMASIVHEMMEAIFISWPTEMQSLIDWAVQQDAFQIIGILCAIERKRTELAVTNQEFITRMLQKLHERLIKLLNRFTDSQIRAIEDTKVKIKKRRGVIAFIRVFPNFSALVESMVPPANGSERLDIRGLIDDAYSRINKAMFDSLKIIAKQSPTGQVYGAATDPEDKEVLNYHILLIENMYHYYTEVEERGDVVLGQWRGKAMLEMSEHQELYVGAVVRRPLGKLLDFLESTETALSSSSARSRAPQTTQPSHSRSVFKKVLSNDDGKEVRRGIDTLRRRIEKHFGEADDPAISQKLVAQVLKECERRYDDVLGRVSRLAGEVYEGSVEVEFGKSDIQQAFRR